MDTLASLIKMANQIGGFFNSYVDRDLARREVANHLQKFWEPRMRIAILNYEAKHASFNNELLPLVREALKMLPAPAEPGLNMAAAAAKAATLHH